MKLVFALLAVCVFGSDALAQWTPQTSGTKARLRGLSAVSEEIAWASGTDGTFLRTTDGGKTWHAGTVPSASYLDFRDTHAVNSHTAYLLSIGGGEQSRILKTTDGGATWATSYVNKDPKGFLDAIAFWDAEHGLALGDPVDGRFVVLTTGDGGKTWEPTPAEGMPLSLPGEGAFAASGTCLVVGGNGNSWFGTGGAKLSRVFRSADRGKTWTAHETPITAGNPSSGVFSLAFHDADHGVAVGGDYKEPGGYRSAVAYVPGTQGGKLAAVGPKGSDVSVDGGETWRRLGTTGFHAVSFAGSSSGWAVGEGGIVAKIEGADLKGW